LISQVFFGRFDPFFKVKTIDFIGKIIDFHHENRAIATPKRWSQTCDASATIHAIAAQVFLWYFAKVNPILKLIG
jgi:hypothetical protein